MRARVLAGIVAGAVALAVYAGTVGHAFVFDDNPEVLDNEAIRSLSNVPALFAQSAWKGAGEDNPIYRPLTTATYALNHAVSGLSPWSYHLLNVLLHAVATALVLAVALRHGTSLVPALGAALVFAVHPIHVEAVANVAGRKDLLVAVFTLAALLAHARAVHRGGAAAIAAPLFLAAALFSKESGLATVGLLLARDVLLDRDAWRTSRSRVLRLYAAYAVVTVGYLAARRIVVGSLGVPLIPFAENPIAHEPFTTRVVTAVAVIGRGLQLLVVPVTLSPDYSYAAIAPATPASDPRLWLGVAGIAAAAAATAWTWRRAPMVAFGIVWYAFTLFPASNLLVPIGTIFGERLLYVPSIGFCLLVGCALAALLATRAATAVRWAGAAIVLLLGWRAVSYAATWRDELSLFSWGVRAQPRSSKMRQSLGAVLMEQGRPADAVPQFEAALDHLRGDPEPASRHELELGVAYEALGRLEDAAAVYERILATDPGYSDARWRLGVVRWAQGRRADAIATWERTVQLDPSHARSLSDLGIAASNAGDSTAARAYWERAVTADPRLASAWYRLGNLYERAGDGARARRAWTEFLRHAGSRFPREQEEVARKLGAAGGPR